MTLTLDESLAARPRKESGGNISKVPEEYLEADSRPRLREELIAGCIEHATEDLEICREWEAAKDEARKV